MSQYLKQSFVSDRLMAMMDLDIDAFNRTYPCTHVSCDRGLGLHACPTDERSREWKLKHYAHMYGGKPRIVNVEV